VVKVLWQLNLRAEAEGADDDERRWLDDRADVHGPWFSQILSRVRRNQLLGLDEDGFDKSGVWRGGQFPLLDLSGELEWERWAEQQSMP
jgi:hypothetical protein